MLKTHPYSGKTKYIFLKTNMHIRFILYYITCGVSVFSLSCLSVVAAMGEKQVVGYIALFLHDRSYASTLHKTCYSLLG